MKIDELVAIDTHTHLEVSCWNPFDAYGEEYDRAADKYFGSSRRPTIDETVAYYRERKIGLVMFTVDSESQLGRRRIPNEEIAEAARKNGLVFFSSPMVDGIVGRPFARIARTSLMRAMRSGFFGSTVSAKPPLASVYSWPQ